MLRLFRIAFAAMILTAGLIGGVSASVDQPSSVVSDLSQVALAGPLSAEQAAGSEHYHFNHGVPEKCAQTGAHTHAHSHCSGCATVPPIFMLAASSGNVRLAALQSFALSLLIDRIDYPPKHA